MKIQGIEFSNITASFFSSGDTVFVRYRNSNDDAYIDIPYLKDLGYDLDVEGHDIRHEKFIMENLDTADILEIDVWLHANLTHKTRQVQVTNQQTVDVLGRLYEHIFPGFLQYNSFFGLTNLIKTTTYCTTQLTVNQNFYKNHEFKIDGCAWPTKTIEQPEKTKQDINEKLLLL